MFWSLIYTLIGIFYYIFSMNLLLFLSISATIYLNFIRCQPSHPCLSSWHSGLEGNFDPQKTECFQQLLSLLSRLWFFYVRHKICLPARQKCRIPLFRIISEYFFFFKIFFLIWNLPSQTPTNLPTILLDILGLVDLKQTFSYLVKLYFL